MSNQDQASLGGVDPEILGRLATRREAIRQGLSVGSVAAAGFAMGSVPVALAALSREAFAQTPADVVGVLQFAFLLGLGIQAFFAPGARRISGGFHSSMRPRLRGFHSPPILERRALFISVDICLIVHNRSLSGVILQLAPLSLWV